MGLAAGWGLTGAGRVAAVEPPPKEHEVQAAFLYNFTKFIEWPAGTFAGADSDFVIAVLGHPALAAELEKAVRDRRIAGHRIAVRPCRTAAEAATGQMVFVAADDAELRELLKRSVGRPVLTVGESERFVHLGGTIAFLFEADDKVRFAINMAAAERAGLRVSAQLQKLARTVIRED